MKHLIKLYYEYCMKRECKYYIHLCICLRLTQNMPHHHHGYITSLHINQNLPCVLFPCHTSPVFTMYLTYHYMCLVYGHIDPSCQPNTYTYILFLLLLTSIQTKVCYILNHDVLHPSLILKGNKLFNVSLVFCIFLSNFIPRNFMFIKLALHILSITPIMKNSCYKTGCRNVLFSLVVVFKIQLPCMLKS